MLGNVSLGEAGGVFAGVIAVLATLGHGIKWLLGFTSQQQSNRQAKLDQWHAELAAREAKIDAEEDAYRLRIEGRLADVEDKQGKLLAICHELASGLRTLNPQSPALLNYDKMLRTAFRVDPATPPDMIAALHEIERVDAAVARGTST